MQKIVLLAASRHIADSYANEQGWARTRAGWRTGFGLEVIHASQASQIMGMQNVQFRIVGKCDTEILAAANGYVLQGHSTWFPERPNAKA